MEIFSTDNLKTRFVYKILDDIEQSFRDSRTKELLSRDLRT